MEYMRGELAPHWSGGPREYKCLYCGKVFIKKNNRKKMLKYCSSKCAGFARTGENNPLWNGGTSFTEYPKAFDKAFKGMIRQRDNYTCAICKQPGKDVHHINYIKMDTTPRNCITLCHSCHNRTNSHREYWQSILTN
jgi:5-methylcytosine-specific restriction endonuclease McrA